MKDDKSFAVKLFWGIYFLFLLTTFFARHIFGLIFIGPAFVACYGLVLLTSFIPFQMALVQFEKSKSNPEKAKTYTTRAWIAFAFSIPIKIVMILYNLSEIIEPTSNHWNFG